MSRRLATLAVAAAFGCGHHDSAPREAPPAGSDPWAITGSASPPEPPSPPPVITVLAPGTEPRRTLVYAPSRGDRHAALQFTINNGDDPRPQTETRVTLQLGWHVPSSLAGPWTFEVEKAQGVPTPGTSPAEQATIDSIWKAFETVRGDVRAISSQDLTPETHSLLATRPSVAALLSMVLVPLPATPVGAGARWRVQQAAPVDGLLETATYELTELAADHISVSVSGSGSAVSADGNDADEAVNGSITVQLADLLPTAADVSLHETMHMTLGDASDAPTPSHVDMTAVIRVQIGP